LAAVADPGATRGKKAVASLGMEPFPAFDV
jgi:hypothetical protein